MDGPLDRLDWGFPGRAGTHFRIRLKRGPHAFWAKRITDKTLFDLKGLNREYLIDSVVVVTNCCLVKGQKGLLPRVRLVTKGGYRPQAL